MNENEISDRRSLLYVAVAQKYHEAVELLIREGAKPDLADSECRAPLHVAAYLGDMKFCQLLLDAEANVNQVDIAGRTPLHVAVWEDNTDVVQFLLEKGAAVDHQAPGEVNQRVTKISKLYQKYMHCKKNMANGTVPEFVGQLSTKKVDATDPI